jgi:predicted esterase YcpF (UPF0227 family)
VSIKYPVNIDLLTPKSFWFSSNKKRVDLTQKVKEGCEKEKAYYIIYANHKVKQNKPSKNLIDISHFSKISLNIDIEYKNLDFSIFVQTFDEISLVDSTQYRCKSGENSISLPRFHPNISSMKLLVRVYGYEDSPSFQVNTFNILVESYHDKIVLTNNTTNLIPNIEHRVLNIGEGEKTYSQKVNGLDFNFYVNCKADKKLIVMLPGTVHREKGIYNFQRYTWSNELDASVMIFLDPTITVENNLSIGWFQGTEKKYALPKVITIIKSFIKDKSIEENEVMIFGSSGGGFSALQLANSFPKSPVMVINPQIKLFNFKESVYKNVLAYSYPNMNEKEVKEKYMDRLSASIDFSKREAPIYYYQNLADDHHVERHLNLFLEEIDEGFWQKVNPNFKLEKDKKLYVLFYNDPITGHSPPSKVKSIEMINNVLDL